MRLRTIRPKRSVEDAGQNPVSKKSKTPKNPKDTMGSNHKPQSNQSLVAARSNNVPTPSASTHRSLWPVRGANNQVTSITISTEVALKPDFWPAQSLCSNVLSDVFNRNQPVHLPLTPAELEQTPPQSGLSDWQMYQILQLGLGRTMAKNHSSDLRSGVGSIRVKRPNRGRAAKVLSNGVWVYGAWQDSRGRTYQLFGDEGVMAGLHNRTKGEIRCLIQNNTPPSDNEALGLPTSTSLGVWHRNTDAAPFGNFAARPGEISSPIVSQPFLAKAPLSTGQLIPDLQPRLKVAQDDSMFPPLNNSENSQNGDGAELAIPEQDEAYPTDHLRQLEMRFPSSEIWTPLARGERRRRHALPVDPLLQDTNTNPECESTDYLGWPQFTWHNVIDNSDSELYNNFHSFDFGGLTGAFNLADAPVASLQFGDTLDAPDFEQCLCEHDADTRTEFGRPEYFRGRPVPPSLWRRHSN